jgi:hypothetical protein
VSETAIPAEALEREDEQACARRRVASGTRLLFTQIVDEPRRGRRAA